MLKPLVVGCVLLCIVVSVHSLIQIDPAHANDCYHPVYFKYFAVGETIQTGHCSIATCIKAPTTIEETLCECAANSTKINYTNGCWSTKDFTKDYPACCEQTRICV